MTRTPLLGSKLVQARSGSFLMILMKPSMLMQVKRRIDALVFTRGDDVLAWLSMNIAAVARSKSPEVREFYDEL